MSLINPFLVLICWERVHNFWLVFWSMFFFFFFPLLCFWHQAFGLYNQPTESATCFNVWSTKYLKMRLFNLFSIVEWVIYQNHNWSLGNDIALGIRTAPSSIVEMAGEAREVWCWQGMETLKSCEALHTVRKAVPPPSLWGPAEDGGSQDFQLQCSFLAPGSASSGVFHG